MCHVHMDLVSKLSLHQNHLLVLTWAHKRHFIFNPATDPVKVTPNSRIKCKFKALYLYTLLRPNHTPPVQHTQCLSLVWGIHQSHKTLNLESTMICASATWASLYSLVGRQILFLLIRRCCIKRRPNQNLLVLKFAYSCGHKQEMHRIEIRL